MSDLSTPGDAMAACVFSEFTDDFAGEVCDGSLHESEPGLGRRCVFMSHDYCVLGIRGVQLNLPETQERKKRSTSYRLLKE